MRYNRFNMIINIKVYYSIDKANIDLKSKFKIKHSFRFFLSVNYSLLKLDYLTYLFFYYF